MNTRKFKMYCDGQFVGFIFISDNDAQFAGLKIGTLWPFGRQGSWTTGDLELIGNRHITGAFGQNMNDEQIQQDLLARTTIRTDCRNFTIQPYD